MTWTAGTRQAVAYTNTYRKAEVGAAKAASLPVITAPFDWAEAITTAAWAPGVVKKLSTQGVDPWQAWQKVTGLLAGRMPRQAMAAGRGVVARSAAAHGGRWRRVADVQPCAWCAMLVTQGPVYRSEVTATTTGSGGAYHNHCGCGAEEIFGTWHPTARERSWIDAYNATGLTGADAAAAMRRQPGTLFHDSTGNRTQTGGGNGYTTQTQTGGAGAGNGSGAKPPAPPNLPFGDMWSEEERARRQAALGMETYGDRLEQTDIEFYEKFKAAGQTPIYIKNGVFVPTNDFRWVERGYFEF